jgi:hypothetical protein
MAWKTIEYSRNLTTSSSTSPGFSYADSVAGEIHTPASFASTTITAYGYNETNGAWTAYDTTLTVEAQKIYPMPVEWAAADKLKLVTNADDSLRPVIIMLKGTF